MFVKWYFFSVLPVKHWNNQKRNRNSLAKRLFRILETNWISEFDWCERIRALFCSKTENKPATDATNSTKFESDWRRIDDSRKSLHRSDGPKQKTQWNWWLFSSLFFRVIFNGWKLTNCSIDFNSFKGKILLSLLFFKFSIVAFEHVSSFTADVIGKMNTTKNNRMSTRIHGEITGNQQFQFEFDWYTLSQKMSVCCSNMLNECRMCSEQ